MSKIDFGAVVVRGADGKISYEETMAFLGGDLKGYMAEVETQDETVGKAVDTVFNNYKKGKPIPTPILCQFALNELNVQPENHEALTKQVMAYLRNNTDRPQVKDEDGTVVQEAEPWGTRKFHVLKGQGGGVQRCADCEPPKPKAKK